MACTREWQAQPGRWGAPPAADTVERCLAQARSSTYQVRAKGEGGAACMKKGCCVCGSDEGWQSEEGRRRVQALGSRKLRRSRRRLTSANRAGVATAAAEPAQKRKMRVSLPGSCLMEDRGGEGERLSTAAMNETSGAGSPTTQPSSGGGAAAGSPSGRGSRPASGRSCAARRRPAGRAPQGFRRRGSGRIPGSSALHLQAAATGGACTRGVPAAASARSPPAHPSSAPCSSGRRGWPLQSDTSYTPWRCKASAASRERGVRARGEGDGEGASNGGQMQAQRPMALQGD